MGASGRWRIAVLAGILAFAGTDYLLRVPGKFDPGTALGAAGAVLAITLAALGAWAESAFRRTAVSAAATAAQTILEQRLEELSASMRSSAQIMQQISTELEARAATAQRLKQEAETAEAISALHKERSEAVSRMLHAQLETATRGIRRDSIRIGVLSFVGGAGVTLLVTLLVHPLG
jgi:hypothetical protein